LPEAREEIEVLEKIYNPVNALILIAVFAISAALAGFAGYEFRDDLPQLVGSRLLALVFFALLIERAVEVIVNNRFIEREMLMNGPVTQLKRKSAVLQAALEQEVQQPVPAMTDPAALAEANSAKNETIEFLRRQIAETKRDKIMADQEAMPLRAALSAEKARYAATTATILGGLIAVTGTTILSGFVVLPEQAGTGTFWGLVDQLQMFAAIDILLTALILAGGSDGVHQIIKGFLSVRNDLATLP
jgi:hypothetical protein